MQAEWTFVLVTPSQWRLIPRFHRQGWQFQFQWLFFYVHRIVV